MVKRGHSEGMTLGDGLWFGWMGDEKFVSGVLATAVLKLGGCVVSWIGKVSLSCCTPDSLCDRGQVIPWNFCLPSVKWWETGCYQCLQQW